MTRDFRDALQDAQAMIEDAARLYRDDPAEERKARLAHIEAGWNFLLEASGFLTLPVTQVYEGDESTESYEASEALMAVANA